METIGVEAVVAGIQAFESGMGRMQKAIDGISPSTNILSQAFEGLGSVVSAFDEHIMNIVDTALGVLLRDAIRAAIDGIRELIGQIIEAGNEFQLMKLRLDGMNLQGPIDAGLEYTAAMKEARKATEEQITWIQALASATPFNSTDIANTYALARSYGFADEAAKRLTKDITDYSASMGLSSDSIVNIIQNLGTMDARGKITFTAIRNLTRSAFLPLDDVLGRVAEKLGTTIPELTKAISKPGEGVPAELFMEAFQEMIEQEPRFIGAAGRLGRAFSAASDNVIDLFRNIGGANIVTPILDVLGEHIASIVDELVTFNDQGELVKTEKWDALVAAASKVGEAVSAIIDELLDLAPSDDQITDTLLDGLTKLSDWLTDNKDDIVQWVKDSINGFFEFKDKVGKWIDYVVGKFGELWTALNSRGEAGERGASPLDEMKKSLSDISQSIGKIFEAITGIPQGASPIDVILVSLKGFSDWVSKHENDIVGFIRGFTDALNWIVENGKTIWYWVSLFGEALLYLFIIAEVSKMVAGFALSIIGVIISLSLLGLAVAITVVIMTTIITVIAAISLAILGIIAVFRIVQVYFTFIGTFLAQRFTDWLSAIRKIVSDMANAITNRDWGALGRAIVNGVAAGIRYSTSGLISALVNAASAAYNAARNYLGIRSPSKLFSGIGENMMLGMTKGINDSVSAVKKTMQGAVMTMTLPAMQAPAMAANYASPMRSNSYASYSTQNNNLTINTNASAEPIIQDFNMLRSLAG